MSTLPQSLVRPRSAEPFLPFALPDIGEGEIAEVVDTLRSGWLTTGPKTRRFEADFAEFLGAPVECLAVNSATAGLHLALEAVGIQPGDEVITTTLTFTATGEVIRYLGAHPVFVDIDEKTLNVDLDALEAAITPRTRAIIVVHYAGLAVDMDRVFDIAARHGLRVIEDAAHSFPATWNGRLIGTMQSDAIVFSFYATKTIATGEGGMVVTRDSAIAARCKVMRLHGISRDAFDRYTSRTPSWYYEVIAPGFKYNLTDVASALGIQQLKRTHELHARRVELADRYHGALGGLPLRLPPSGSPGNSHAWHLYVIRLTEDAPISRDEFIAAMAARGIGCSVHFIPMHRHPYWRDTYQLRPEMFPRAERVFAGLVSLPLYTRMTNDDQERVIREVRDLLGGGPTTTE